MSAAPVNAPEPRDYCPHCGVAYEPLQEYCLECGTRLPVNRGVVGVLATTWQRRLAWYPGDWIWPVALFFVLTVAATAAVLLANGLNGNAAGPATALSSVPFGAGSTQGHVPVASTATTPNAPSVTVTTGPLPTAPGAPSTTPTPRPANPNALAVWPATKSGYTVVLLSLPLAGGHTAAVSRARQAKQKGLKNVGVLVSSQYTSLHPGYYVVFAGIYGTQNEAVAAISSAHARGFPGAYQAHVTR